MKETISFRIEGGTREKLDSLALVLNTDRSALIDEAIRAYLEFHAWFISEVERGLHAAESEEFVTPHEVEEVFTRLTSV